jgi:hypothetical protein
LAIEKNDERYSKARKLALTTGHQNDELQFQGS